MKRTEQESAERHVVVALRLSLETGRRKLRGIRRYLTESGARWRIDLRRDGEEFLADDVRALVHQKVSGVLVSLSHQLPHARKAMQILAGQTGIPLVPICMHDMPEFAARKRRIAFVEDDIEACAVLAAEHFSSIGRLVSYGFVPRFGAGDWSKRRGRSFAAALKARGNRCAFYSPTANITDDLTKLTQWILKLPKPCGILVDCDPRAFEIVQCLKDTDLTVPEDVSIIGFSNDTVTTELTDPKLTSVDFDSEAEGYRAAALLDELMSGRRFAHPPVLTFPPRQLVVRNSTMPCTYAGKLVQRALACIASEATHGITPNDIAARLGISRRLLDLRFSELQRCSVGEALREGRLQAVCARLRDTSNSIATIAEECGFQNATYLKTLFRRRFGCTPGDYRARMPPPTER